MAQRFGRVNRFGERIDTEIHVIHSTDHKDADYQQRLERTFVLLTKLNGNASPHALGELPEADRLDAFAPKPTILPATDILFDAWALTTIDDRLPGRPEVGPYLHGLADDLPQTTIAWRIELDLLKDEPQPESAFKAIFAKHGIRPHESLTVRSFQAAKFLKEITAPKVRPHLLEVRVALIFTHGLKCLTVKELVDNPGLLNAEPTLVLPASFGGLDDKGMLTIPKLLPSQRRET